MIIIPTILSAKPVLDISNTLSRLVPKIIALGAVAEGSIKANEAAIVAGSMNKRGFISMLMASPANTGRKVSTVATLEVSSVKKVIKRATDNTIINGCTPLSHINWSPNHWDNPESLNPLAKAKPPPNNRMISHGIFSAVFQSMRNPPSLFLEGIRNKMIPIVIATVPSFKNLGY